MDLARKTNVYIDKKEPWALAKDPDRADSLDVVLSTLVRILVVLTTMLSPVMPEKMSTLAEYIGLDKIPTFQDLNLTLTHTTVKSGAPLFPRDHL